MSKHTENPSNERRPLPPNFRPMATGVLRLKVPERDGFHRHWFRGTPDRIAQALQAGYTFVDAADVSLNNFDVAGYSSVGGNSSLGINGILVKYSVALILSNLPSFAYIT